MGTSLTSGRRCLLQPPMVESGTWRAGSVDLRIVCLQHKRGSVVRIVLDLICSLAIEAEASVKGSHEVLPRPWLRLRLGKVLAHSWNVREMRASIWHVLAPASRDRVFQMFQQLFLLLKISAR